MAVTFVNSVGKRYFLFRNNRNKNLFYFSDKKSIGGATIVKTLPSGRKIIESKITNLPLLAKR